MRGFFILNKNTGSLAYANFTNGIFTDVYAKELALAKISNINFATTNFHNSTFSPES